MLVGKVNGNGSHLNLHTIINFTLWYLCALVIHILGRGFKREHFSFLRTVFNFFMTELLQLIYLDTTSRMLNNKGRVGD